MCKKYKKKTFRTTKSDKTVGNFIALQKYVCSGEKEKRVVIKEGRKKTVFENLWATNDEAKNQQKTNHENRISSSGRAR